MTPLDWHLLTSLLLALGSGLSDMVPLIRPHRQQQAHELEGLLSRSPVCLILLLGLGGCLGLQEFSSFLGVVVGSIIAVR
jgi:hypothetical protein